MVINDDPKERHLCCIPANDAHIVSVLKLLRSGIRIPRVHVVNGSSRQNDIIKSFLEGPSCQVHGPDCEQRQRVDPDHDNDEQPVQNDLDEADDQLGVEHEHGFVFPRVLAVEVDAVQHVLDQRVGHDREQNGVLKAEHELHRGPFREGGLIRVEDEVDIDDCQQGSQRNDPDVEQE